jgi:hypothetical protein
MYDYFPNFESIAQFSVIVFFVLNCKVQVISDKKKPHPIKDRASVSG